MYAVTYSTKQGGSGILIAADFEPVRKKVIELFKQRLPATVLKDGEKISGVFRDDSCRLGWNWMIETPENNTVKN